MLTDVQNESQPVPLLRDPRSEYEVLPSGRDIGKEVGHVPPQHQTAIVPLTTSLLAGQVSDSESFCKFTYNVKASLQSMLSSTGIHCFKITF